MTPTPIEWHSREVAATWPEGSVVIVRVLINDGVHWHAIDKNFQPRFVAGCYWQNKEFALLELPRKDGGA